MSVTRVQIILYTAAAVAAVVGLAEAMGVPAKRVDRPEDLAPVLKQAIDHQDGPFLVDVVIESPVPHG